MINLNANKQLKAMGCKWSGSTWIAPDLCEDEARLIKDYFYADLIIVDVVINEKETLYCSNFGSSHARIIAGYIIATANGRDNGARIMDDVAVLNGKFTSGGSIKNYMCNHTENLTVRLKVSRNALGLLDEEVKDGLYTYTIHEPNKKIGNPLSKFTKEELMSEIEFRNNNK